MAQVLEGYANILQNTGRVAEAQKMQDKAQKIQSKQPNVKGMN